MTGPDLALPGGYADLLKQLKRDVAAARWQVQRVVNTELVALYWRLGDAVLKRQQAGLGHPRRRPARRRPARRLPGDARPVSKQHPAAAQQA